MTARFRSLLVAVGTVASAAVVVGSLPEPAVVEASHDPGGAPIFVGGDVTGVVDVFSHDGLHLDDWDGNFTFADGFAAGDVNGDGSDEILVAGDVTGVIDIFDINGNKVVPSFDGDFT